MRFGYLSRIAVSDNVKEVEPASERTSSLPDNTERTERAPGRQVLVRRAHEPRDRPLGPAAVAEQSGPYESLAVG